MDHESIAQSRSSSRENALFIQENEYFFCPDSKYLRWEEKKLLEFVRENDSTVFFFFPLFWLANHSLAFTYFLQMTLTTRCRRQHFLIKAQSTIIARAAFGAYPDNDSSVSYHQKIALEYQKKKKYRQTKEPQQMFVPINWTIHKKETTIFEGCFSALYLFLVLILVKKCKVYI